MPPGSTRTERNATSRNRRSSRRSGAVVGELRCAGVHSHGGVPFALECEPKRCRRKVIHMNEVVGQRWTIAASDQRARPLLDALRRRIRHLDGNPATGREESMRFLQDASGLRHVLEHVRQRDRIVGLIDEGEGVHVALMHRCAAGGARERRRLRIQLEAFRLPPPLPRQRHEAARVRAHVEQSATARSPTAR